MHRILVILLLTCLIFCHPGLAQFDNPIVIPDTLSGSGFLLKMGNSSKEILPGSVTSTYAYNSFPYLGPTLILRKDSMVMATVSNLIDDSTTLHWHGLHIPAHADGGPHSPILPGMDWEAHFECKDPAGTNWYHPHFHGKTAKQTLKGAAGLIIVRDEEEAALPIPRTYGIDDIPLVIQSLQLDPDNQILPDGQQDSIVLVNGVHLPFAKVPAQVLRFRILNASNARNFNLGFSDDRAFSVIGTDGSLLGTPVSLTRVRIAPGERLEILVNLIGLEGQSTQIKSFGSEIPPGTHGGPTIIMPVGSPPNHSPLDGTDFAIMELRIQPPLSGAFFVIPETLVHQTRYLESQSTFDRTIVFSSIVPGSAAGPFLLNDSTFNMERIDFSIPVNRTEIWTLNNQTVVAHPFHMHGFPFYILDRFGSPVSNLESGRKDMVMVNPNETLRIITRFSDFGDSTMPYMFHCHILTHEDEGMMGQFVVLPEPTGILPIQAAAKTPVPNPFTDFIQIRNNETEDIQIINSLGKTMPLKSNEKGLVNTREWPSGVYIIRQVGSQSKLLKL